MNTTTTELTKLQRHQIQAVIAQFDFEKVANVMGFLEWTWYGKNGVPTVEDLMDLALRILEEVAISSGGYISTGGFTARHENDEFSLVFELESSYSGMD